MPPSSWASLLSSARRLRHPERDRPPTSNSHVSGGRLAAVLGARELLLLGVGASVGSGIFVVTGVAAKEAGPAVTLSFLLAALACVADALSYAELSARFPGVVGGAYLYCYATFGELASFVLFCQLMLDYHIGAASIARSLASHLAAMGRQLAGIWWTGHLAMTVRGGGDLLTASGGMFGAGKMGGESGTEVTRGGVMGGTVWGVGGEMLGGHLSLNWLAPVMLGGITAVLCRGAKESSAVNSIMTVGKVLIVVLVVAVGVTQVTPSNWEPFAPNGYKSVLSATSVVFFAYVGFDAVANTAEESRNPGRDLPVGILGSLGICALLYLAVALVVTGMVPYDQLDAAAPLAAAFAAKGLPAVGLAIDIGAATGLATTLLAGLYVQARLYMVLGRDGFFPEWISAVHPANHIPLRAQILVGGIAASMATLFDVAALSHILSVGVLLSYSVVCVCVVMQRIESHPKSLPFLEYGISRWDEAVIMAGITAVSSFLGGLSARFGAPWWISFVLFIAMLAPLGPLYFRQVYNPPPGFSCPLVPALPILGMAFNVYLVAQMHVEAYIRIVVVTVFSILVYVFYGQFHAGLEVSESDSLEGEENPNEAPSAPLLITT